MKYYRIVNWPQYQHYKDRNPPWIKLHCGLLSSSTWIYATDASRVLAITCMILAAKTGNRIPADAKYFRTAGAFNGRLDFSYLLAERFIEEEQDASTMLATGYQDAMPSKRREYKQENINHNREEIDFDSETLVRQIQEAHPKKQISQANEAAIIDCIEVIASRLKIPSEQAAQHLLERTRKFAELTALWPRDRMVKGATNWFRDGDWAQEDRCWEVNSNGSSQVEEARSRALRELPNTNA